MKDCFRIISVKITCLYEILKINFTKAVIFKVLRNGNAEPISQRELVFYDLSYIILALFASFVDIDKDNHLINDKIDFMYSILNIYLVNMFNLSHIF